MIPLEEWFYRFCDMTGCVDSRVCIDRLNRIYKDCICVVTNTEATLVLLK